MTANDQRRAISIRVTSDCQRHRAGYSLVEMLVVMSMLAAIMGLVGTVFHRLFASDQLAMRRALLERSTSRLSDRFRQDVHSATDHRLITPEKDDPDVLELLASPEGFTVKYSVAVGSVRRDVFDKERRIGFDRFLLPESTASFAAGADSAWIVLAIERPLGTVTSEPTATPSRRTLTIEAELGREARLARRFGETAPAQEKSPMNESTPSKQESPEQESSK